MKNIYPLNSRFTLPFAFVLAVSLLVVSLMFMLPGGLLHAQTGTIEYPENGTGAVATFTAVDPEGESIVWSLAETGDDEDFAIVNGVLRFENPPDFENLQGGGNGTASNTYTVTVQASDGGMDTTATKAVTIEVTNVEEPGTVMLSTLQPQVGVSIMATLTDPDNIMTNNPTGSITDGVTWQWYRGSSEIVGAIQSLYAPMAGDVGSRLRATATYRDAEDIDNDKTAQEDSANAAREAPASNIPPQFPDQNPATDADDKDQEREVAENTPAGTNLGAPIAASDPSDVLTYSLSGTDAASFSINRATGQLSTKAALDFEDTNNPSNDEFTVMVTATDPFGAFDEATVTITLTDVNESPSVMGAASIDHAENGTVLGTNAETGGVQPANYAVSDPDADDTAALEVTLRGTDEDKFSIDNGQLAFKEAPDYESPGDSDANNVYEVTVKVTDTDGNSDEQDVTVKVTNMEEDGEVTLSTLQPRVGFPVTATLEDPDNVTAGSVSWQWYNGIIDTDDLTDNAIEDATSDTYTPVADDIGDILTAVAIYTDGSPNEGDTKDVVAGPAEADKNAVLVDTRNKAPVFPDKDTEMEGRQTAQERSVLENTPSGMPIDDPVEATDEDTVANRDLTYSLGRPDAASFDIVRNSGQLQTKAELDKETKDTYTVTVTATDSLGASSTITVTIKVNNEDEMPDLEGEAPEEYAENGTRPVATFMAVDPEGESIVWSLAETGDDEDFAIVNGVLRFENPPDFENLQGGGNGTASNTYTVTVQASDGGMDTTATKAVTIEVTNVEEPGTVMLSTLQPQVGVAITATLTDPDNETADSVTWQWYRGRSEIVGVTQNSYTSTTGDVGNILRATAMYDDGEGKDKTAQEDSYRNVRRAPATNTDPQFPDQAQEREVAENTPAGTDLGAPIAASDPSDVLTYSLSGTDAASFSINRATGQLSTKAALDFEDTNNPSNDEFTVMVTATDPFGAFDEATVTITLTDVNESPSVMGAASIDHAENGTVLDANAETGGVQPANYAVSDPDADDTAALEVTLRGTDEDKFSIDNGQLAFKEAPDYESPGDSDANNVYEVTVKVTDTDGNSDEQDVTVKVTNMEEDGEVTLSTLQPRVGFPVTATLEDPDNVTAGSVSWQWYNGIIDTDDLTDNAIEDATSATYTPTTDDINNTLTARVTYTDGFDDAEDVARGPAAEDNNMVLADTRNKAPEFPDQDDDMEGRQTDQKLTVMENTDPDTVILGFELATDSTIANDGIPTPEILTYSLGGADAASFTIDRATAQLSTKVALDKETKDTYTVTVTATDPSGETATATVTITVTNVDEAPMIMVGGLAISGMRNVDYAENRTDAVATYTATGPESDSATWSLSGDDAGDFNISRSGVLTFRSSPDYEISADADNNNIYMVTVKADDGTYTDTHDVTIMVTDEDEAPFAPSAPNVLPTVGEPTSLDVSWTAPSNGGGPDITSYDLQYRMSGSGNFIAGPQNVTGTSTTITGLTEGTSYEVQVRATNDEGDSGWSTAGMGSTGTSSNNAPIFPDPTLTRSIMENTEADTNVGAVILAATDADRGDTLTYTMEGTNAASFTFDASTRQIKTSADLDFETKSSYSVTIKVSDGTDSDTVVVTVTVTDVNEAPTISGLSNTDYAENGTAPVATFTAMDPEGTAISWTLEGTDADALSISSDGVLRFRSPPDYETKTTYMITLKASDGTNMASHEVAIMVTDVDEVPTIEGDATIDYAENGTGDVATFTAMDPEGTAISWTLEGTDAGVFDISSGGVLTFRSSPDYEMAADANIDNIYMVTVEASDGTNMDILEVAITVTDEDDTTVEQDLFNRYNTDGDQEISKSEAIEAINDYIFGEGDDAITKEQVLIIINLYLFG